MFKFQINQRVHQMNSYVSSKQSTNKLPVKETTSNNNCWLLSASIATNPNATEAIDYYTELLADKGYDVHQMEKDGLPLDKTYQQIYEDMGLEKIKIDIKSVKDIQRVLEKVNGPIVMLRPALGSGSTHAETIIGIEGDEYIAYDTMMGTKEKRNQEYIDMFLSKGEIEIYIPITQKEFEKQRIKSDKPEPLFMQHNEKSPLVQKNKSNCFDCCVIS
ncbi:MAG: hypothetical protein EP298_08055 [Gammaproteobacteria bacterium]|nr:MAG: hypothetical protein EP298_08055 [Gammaproteobacteria bacterium]UTW42919.1 hypothetical protein KFE69_01905 [bacterium SCSIO 12844]